MVLSSRDEGDAGRACVCAGTNNIPIEAMTEAGVPVFNTPGANANSVKEMVLCGLLLTRNITGCCTRLPPCAHALQPADTFSSRARGARRVPQRPGASAATSKPLDCNIYAEFVTRA